MKRFFLKAFVFLLIPICINFILQHYVDKGLRKSCSFFYKEWNDIINAKINGDFIILGSSRAWVQFSPKVIDSSLNVSSYNLGIDSYNFLMQYYRFKLLLKYNKRPKYILESLEEQTLYRRPTLMDYQQFLPYLNDPIVKEATTYYHGLDYGDYYMPMYKYRNDLDLIYQGLKTLLFQDKKCDNEKYKGFEAMNRTWTGKEFKEFREAHPKGIRFELDTVTIKLFDEFLNYCKKTDIKVIFVYSPEQKEAQRFIINRDSIMTIYDKFSLKYNIPILDYSNNPICDSTRYFYNSQHLNVEGVNLFNKYLVSDLKKIMRQ